jgi:hypothetical protein
MFNYCPPKVLADLKSETFPDGKRYYTLEDGTKLPSVTTVLGTFDSRCHQTSVDKGAYIGLFI